MSAAALVLAAHGSALDLAANTRVADLARRVAGRLGLEESSAAFHCGEPRFDEVLDCLAADEVVVIPFFTSEGHYSDKVLPEQLAKNHRYPEVALRTTVPVGLHPEIGVLVSHRLTLLRRRFSLGSARVAILAHGTRRHSGSRRSAEALSERLAESEHVPAKAFFFDEDPLLEEIEEFCRGFSVLAVPFLIGGGRHTRVDLARRLGFPGEVGEEPVAAERPGGSLVLDRALGLDPGLERILIDLARS